MRKRTAILLALIALAVLAAAIFLLGRENLRATDALQESPPSLVVPESGRD